LAVNFDSELGAEYAQKSVYYFHAVLCSWAAGHESMAFSVATGNFGDNLCRIFFGRTWLVAISQLICPTATTCLQPFDVAAIR